MDYEKKYKEAMERARKIHDEIVNNEVIGFPGQITDIFPELAESDDERIRKMCIAAVNIAASADGGLLHSEASECLAWLEEQKDKNCLACDQHLKGYIAGRKATEEEKQKENPKTAISIPADCVSLAKCEDRDSKYGVFPEDVIVVARACEKLEAHGYSELAHALKNVNLYTKPIDYDHEMWKNCEANFEGGKKEVIDHPEKYGLQKGPENTSASTIIPSCWAEEPSLQKEQKPVGSYEIVPYIDDKIAELQDMWREERVAFDWDDVKDMIEDAVRHFYHQEQKPAEWSEEDEKNLELVTDCVYEFYPDPVMKYKLKDWLKSLRPQWKPTEEQIEALQRAIDACESEWAYQDDELRSLLNDLKKL